MLGRHYLYQFANNLLKNFMLRKLTALSIILKSAISTDFPASSACSVPSHDCSVQSDSTYSCYFPISASQTCTYFFEEDFTLYWDPTTISIYYEYASTSGSSCVEPADGSTASNGIGSGTLTFSMVSSG